MYIRAEACLTCTKTMQTDIIALSITPSVVSKFGYLSCYQQGMNGWTTSSLGKNEQPNRKWSIQQAITISSLVLISVMRERERPWDEVRASQFTAPILTL